MFERSGMLGGVALWSSGGTLLCPFSKKNDSCSVGVTSWILVVTKQDSSLFWWMNTFENHDFHEKTAERKTHSCS